MYDFDFWFQHLLLNSTELEQEVLYQTRENLLDNWHLIIQQYNDNEEDYL